MQVKVNRGKGHHEPWGLGAKYDYVKMQNFKFLRSGTASPESKKCEKTTSFAKQEEEKIAKFTNFGIPNWTNLNFS